MAFLVGLQGSCFFPQADAETCQHRGLQRIVEKNGAGRAWEMHNQKHWMDFRGPRVFCVHFLSRSPSSALLPFFGGEGSPTKIDYRKKGTLTLTSLLEDLVVIQLLGSDNL